MLFFNFQNEYQTDYTFLDLDFPFSGIPQHPWLLCASAPREKHFLWVTFAGLFLSPIVGKLCTGPVGRSREVDGANVKCMLP